MAHIISDTITARVQEFCAGLCNAICMTTLQNASEAKDIYNSGIQMVTGLYQKARTLYASVLVCYIHLVGNTPAAFWLLHPMGQFAFFCLILASFCSIMAFDMGFLQDIKDGCAWVKRCTYRCTRFTRPEAREHPREQINGNTDRSNDASSDWHAEPVATTPTDDKRTWADVLPDPRPPYTREYAKTPVARNSSTMNKSLLQKEGLFNSDATLSRAAGKLSLGKMDERKSMLLAHDHKERTRWRERALEKMRKGEIEP
jgi:hypothetical protein